MHKEEYVGNFYQCSFSTKQKAKNFIDKIAIEDLKQFGETNKDNFTIKEHIIDAGCQ